jgi:hypothetical protein
MKHHQFYFCLMFDLSVILENGISMELFLNDQLLNSDGNNPPKYRPNDNCPTQPDFGEK